ncbi:hypothetical protein [Hymenobacter nivis]|uniref:Uncharacterized protein n=1 Tax=Hymenobacter nivis TaxID=1850093 RepID=A0A2Z3GG15_9BACT|nr:hypothetical protein [Hymenobacter nivis]AWM32513.1 hypothetical protein DDQ68_06755 [Hymenobacter nivis]
MGTAPAPTHFAGAPTGFTAQHRTLGRAAAWAVFGLGVAYAAVTGLGMYGLRSPADPIGEPFFSLMELLIVLMVPPLVVSLVAVQASPARPGKDTARRPWRLCSCWPASRPASTSSSWRWAGRWRQLYKKPGAKY